MSQGKRPGGLTALAVFNFIFGGFGLLGVLVLAGFLAILSGANLEGELQVTMKEAFDKAGMTSSILMMIVVFGFMVASLQVISGIGYLLQKKFLGRFLGNMFAVLALVNSLVTACMLPAEGGGGGGINTIIGLIFPILTLILLNTTFKKDFIK